MEDSRFGSEGELDEKQIEYYSLLQKFIDQPEVSYWIGNPSVEIINGTITLKPLNHPTRHCKTSEQYFTALREVNLTTDNSNEYPSGHYYLLLNGPSQLLYNSPLSRYETSITEVRIIRTNQLRYYAVLLLFPQQKIGRQCFEELLGRQYNEVEIERIIPRQIIEVSLSYNEPKLGILGELARKKKSEDQEKVSPEHIFYSERHKYTGGVKVEEKNTCTICLEELSGQIISVLCGHYFHKHCLEGWAFNTCPLCRYYQQPPVVTFCQQCNQSDSLWVCLLCGRRLCCGSVNDILSEDSHIYQHCKDTGHALSMEIQTKFLFDARIPAFLHQMFYRELIQKGGQEEIQDKDMSKKNKVSEKIAHYEKEVADEMHNQRNYYEEEINRLLKKRKGELNIRRQKMQMKSKELEDLKQEELTLIEENTKLAEEVEKYQKQQSVINTLLKMKAEKAEINKKKASRNSELQKKRLSDLQALIQQRKQELLNYKQNIVLQNQLKNKLKGEQVGEDIVFVNDNNRKKKK